MSKNKAPTEHLSYTDKRDAFLQLIDEHWNSKGPLPKEIDFGGETVQVRWLLGQLWHCTDILPGDYYQTLELEGSQTYAVAARRVLEEFKEEQTKK